MASETTVRRTVGDRLTVAALCAIVAISVLASLAWLRTVPIFGEPDEQVHLDYALTIARSGWPFPASLPATGQDTDDLLRDLEATAHYGELRFDSSYRIAPEIRSGAWRARFDRAAPRDDAPRRIGEAYPSIVTGYPPGFYLCAAVLYRAARIAGLGAYEAVTAMRSLGTIALAVTLFTAFAILRRLRFDRPTALLATLAVGVFPLTSWASASFQPDTFTTASVAIALLCALRVRASPDLRSRYLALGIAIAAISCVKTHYAALALVGLLPVAASRIVERSTLRRTAYLCGAIALAALAIVVNAHALPHVAGPPAFLAQKLFAQSADLFDDFGRIFVGGVAHDTFWTSRDWIDTAYFAPPALAYVRDVLSIGSIAVVAAIALTISSFVRRIVPIARKHIRPALGLAMADAPLSLYVVWTLGLVVIDLSYPGHLGLLGRYWLPVLVPTIAIVARTLVRLKQPQRRAKLALAVSTVWLAYGLVAWPFAFAQMRERFYGPAIARSALDRYVHVDRIWDARGQTFTTETIAFDRSSSLCVRGLAIDSRYGLPARGAAFLVDGKRWPLRYGIRRTAPDNIYNDVALTDIGFDGCVPANALAVGAHDARLIFIAKDGAALRWPPHLRLVVAPAES